MQEFILAHWRGIPSPPITIQLHSWFRRFLHDELSDICMHCAIASAFCLLCWDDMYIHVVFVFCMCANMQCAVWWAWLWACCFSIHNTWEVWASPQRDAHGTRYRLVQYSLRCVHIYTLAVQTVIVRIVDTTGCVLYLFAISSMNRTAYLLILWESRKFRHYTIPRLYIYTFGSLFTSNHRFLWCCSCTRRCVSLLLDFGIVPVSSLLL
jgi:hypothetical protein